MASKPPSLSSNMKKAGLIMIASPDVVTDIPGVALVAASYLAKRRDPAGFKELADETRKLLREMRTLRI